MGLTAEQEAILQKGCSPDELERRLQAGAFTEIVCGSVQKYTRGTVDSMANELAQLNPMKYKQFLRVFDIPDTEGLHDDELQEAGEWLREAIDEERARVAR